MSSIKVALRARPWTLDDRLGIRMEQVGAEQGTIDLINSDYSTKFFSFSYSWWTAFNWKHHCTNDDDREVCDNMKLVTQDDVYDSVGQKIKADLYDGNAVVLFAYGLSGSGKTYTVFGMDDVKNKNSWFFHATPDKNWGVFPRLAYDIFQDRKEGWKISMKYFQNVVDIVRDLMSPQGTEKIYKEGMRKDADGFMDIEWCQSQTLNSWDELRQAFLAANARKAIAPTQFNHQSTRGHCIMTIEVLMPDEQDPNMKKRGRVYVCDLAGTEPAGDIFYAVYEAKQMNDGSIEQALVGPHKNQTKTKELQDQGKKINLSLSEMAQFFMKMAEAYKAKKLKPGVSIPGCNTYFLCKYLKDTMLQAKTYLFCAIRPEVTYLKYTFATLGFAKNASVVQLSPKKATTAKSAAERKLMAELDKYKAMVEALQKNQGQGGDDEVKRLQDMLSKQQEELQRVVNEDDGPSSDVARRNAEEQERKVKQYASRGITLYERVDFDLLDQPYFVNIDEDEFRTKRFVYLLKEGETKFGPDGDVRPPSFSVKKNHCSTLYQDGKVMLICGDGTTLVAGTTLNKDERYQLKPGDWVCMGMERLQFFHKAEGPPDPQRDPEDIFNEIGTALTRATAAANLAGGGNDELAKRIKELEAQNSELQNTSKDQDTLKTTFDEAEVMNVINLIHDVKEICEDFDRPMLQFEPVLARQDRTEGGQGKTFIKVTHTKTEQVSLVSDADFAMKHSMLKDDRLSMLMSFEANEEFLVPDEHDPVSLFFEDMFHICSGRHFCEYLAYNFNTEDEDKDVHLVASTSPYHNSGILNIDWTPVGEPLEVESPEDMLGKPWTFTLKIQNAALKVRTRQCYVSYLFPNESGELEKFITDTCEQETMTPSFDYVKEHHIPSVTQGFLDFLTGKNGMDFDIWASPTYRLPPTKISTSNEVVAQRFKQNIIKSGTEAQIEHLHRDNEQLQRQLELAITELATVTKEDRSIVKQRLLNAVIQDSQLNSPDTKNAQ